MTEARANGPTATLLPDGTVLVVGGDGSSGPLASAEVHDPSTGSWTATGSMIEARANHTATLLPDGRVLVAGGNGSLGLLASAELYDPGSGSWTATGSMIEARYGHTATLLPDGRVLVAVGAAIFTDGDVSGPDPLASAELFDPSSGTWGATGTMGGVRFGHTATLLPDGTVLVAGGEGSFGSGDPASAELYDPRSGSWTVTGSMHAARAYHTATLLLDGTVLAAGGGVIGVLASAELFDPGSGTWTATGNMNGGRAEHPATLLLDGTVLVAGGNSGSSGIGFLASAELFDPGSGSWTATGSMIEARDFPMATLLSDGSVLVAGGSNQQGCTPGTPCSGSIVPLASAELYDPGSGS
ncbi:MAG TPA: kelch repeat-containing protein [Nitriliruptorales bacterium]